MHFQFVDSMNMEDENKATETSGVRIFVGGLGEGVTDDDLQRLFGSLGSVDGVEIIRTKGRSFAYVDFVPSPSDQKSLSKLFSRVMLTAVNASAQKNAFQETIFCC